jgi:23S rRNA-/tRNA-specific pseudouridylate synthase
MFQYMPFIVSIGIPAASFCWQTMHYSLVEIQPLTGRKHQIRRHAKLAGHPVVGDRRYGSARSISYLARHCDFDRLGLHAYALTIRLPEASAARTFRSPGLPASMVRLIEADR